MLELAKLQYETGELAEARVCLGRALQSAPQNPDALNLQRVLDQSFDDISGGYAMPMVEVSTVRPLVPR